MASFTFGFGGPFPAGTTVECYPDVGQKKDKEPSAVAAITSAVVQSNGTLSFTGLLAGAPYYAVAFVAGKWKWVSFRTSGETGLSIEDGKGVVNHGAAAGVARPDGFSSVEWIGSVEPTHAIDGDTWVDTSV